MALAKIKKVGHELHELHELRGRSLYNRLLFHGAGIKRSQTMGTNSYITSWQENPEWQQFILSKQIGADEKVRKHKLTSAILRLCGERNQPFKRRRNSFFTPTTHEEYENKKALHISVQGL
jgi:hypothetical protein